MEKFSKIEVNDITSDVLLSLQDDLLSCEKWGNSSKKAALTRLSHFMAYAFKITRNKNISVALTEFSLLKDKIASSKNHYKTLDSTNNAVLRSELVKAIQRILRARTKYKKNLLLFLYIPMRIAEVLSTTVENVTRENIFIPKTKTIKASQGGFNVPINEKVYQIVTDNLPLAAEKQRVMSQAFVRLTGFNVHGIRSLFSDYMTREGFQWNLIESCLSHKTSNAVAECYHRDQRNYFYEQRKPLMYHWYGFISECIEEARRLNEKELLG
jgi:integrase